MIFFRRRLFFWLVKAYLRRWRKAILFFFVIGLGIFFLLKEYSGFILSKVFLNKRQVIGIVGSYTPDTLPPPVMADLSRGFTSIQPDGTPIPDVVEKWIIQDSGKKYVFSLKKRVYYTDGTELTSSTIPAMFRNVLVDRPDKYTIAYTLKNSYSPFLVTVSRPILKNGYIGVGNYKIKKLSLNGNFVESISLVSIKNALDTKTYNFYPSEEALKLAFSLGEVTKMIGLSTLSVGNDTFASFPNASVQKVISYRRLVTVFYNTKDKTLSNEKLRGALSYSLPDDFSEGIRNHSPFSPLSWASSGLTAEHQQDINRAESLLSQSASSSSQPVFTIHTPKKYEKVAREVSSAWKQIGIRAQVELSESAPNNFEIFLGDFIVPKDPDQYTLWHRNQENNITRYSNVRIDKLLEDGRTEIDMDVRRKVYADFQKYLLVDSPASFLYFPFEYEVTRK